MHPTFTKLCGVALTPVVDLKIATGAKDRSASGRQQQFGTAHRR
jgi:hypothetical protein